MSPVIIEHADGLCEWIGKRFRFDFLDDEKLEKALLEIRELRSDPGDSPSIRTVLPATRSIIVEWWHPESDKKLRRIVSRYRGRKVWARSITREMNNFRIVVCHAQETPNLHRA